MSNLKNRKEVIKMSELSMKMQELMAKFKRAREIQLTPFKNNVVLMDKIPELATAIFKEEFGINIKIKEAFPLVFIFGWKEIVRFCHAQPTNEFAFEVCGVRIEYRTENSESDKPRNIVPQLIHKNTPIFTHQSHDEIIGARSNQAVAEKYQAWRTNNLTETVDKIERDVMATMANDFGVDLMVSSAVLPMMAATYVAGLQIARDTKQDINMYNVFEISIGSNDAVILNPYSIIKGNIKNDENKEK